MTSDGVSVVLADDLPAVDTLVVGVSEYGLAGLTAVDYLTDQRPMEGVGHVQTDGPPSLTPFEGGTPRHHTRLYVDDEASLAVMVGERFVPPAEAGPTAAAVMTAAQRLAAANVTMLSGVPMAHGPDDHDPFYIATTEYQTAYLEETDIRAMGNGFLDGLRAELVARSMRDGPPTGC